ncbi:MAG: LLM class flavin-dependent oxidoreductase, partial [Gammaproteobacteria bacterium]|nr:LLM class flavin-dependent oxidoreductase [Gammaproteobacteria bacterium]
YYDGVILHTFMSDEAVAASVKIVRDSAEQAGRDPESVRVWTVLATACDPDEEDYLRKIVARMATYMQAPGYGELLAKVNGWDQAVIDAFRKDSVVASMLGGIDSVASLEQLQHIRGLIPEHWLPAAAGTPQQCAERFNDQFKAGADGVIIHASTPSEFAPVIETYKNLRDNEKFSQRSNQPFLPMMETSA